MFTSLVHPQLKAVHENPSKADEYYNDKYKYLVEHGFFQNPYIVELGSVDQQMIEREISKVPEILFEVTDSCNLKCTYCGYGDLYEVVDERNAKGINTDKALVFLEYILKLKIAHKRIRLNIGFYGGEPLVNSKFIEAIVAASKEINANQDLLLQYSMTTNGTLIHKYLGFLVDNDFNLTVSLDGNKLNDSYRLYKVHGQESFDRVIENIDLIYNSFPQYFRDHINFISVLHDRNSVASTYEFIYSRYHKIPIVTELATKDVKSEKRNIINKMFKDKRNSENDYFTKSKQVIANSLFSSSDYNESKDYIKSYTLNHFMSNLSTLLHKQSQYFPTSTCLPLGRKIFMTNRNKLLPCEKVNYTYCMGIVDNEVRIDIPAISKLYSRRLNQFRELCQHCYAYRFCGQCMYHLPDLDKPNQNNVSCKRFYDQNRFKNKLSNVISYLEKHPSHYFCTIENLETK